ncbi:hypothetical protein P3S68_004470 [Capsicum galapagoense]
MLGMFLLTCAHEAENRMIQDIFQYSGETVHRHFHTILKFVCELARDMIRPHPNYNDGVGFHKSCNKQYLSFFKDCIGALDGTHVKARLPQGQEIPYIERKGYSHMKGYMAPYKGHNVRYHLTEFRHRAIRQL